MSSSHSTGSNSTTESTFADQSQSLAWQARGGDTLLCSKYVYLVISPDMLKVNQKLTGLFYIVPRLGFQRSKTATIGA